MSGTPKHLLAILVMGITASSATAQTPATETGHRIIQGRVSWSGPVPELPKPREIEYCGGKPFTIPTTKWVADDRSMANVVVYLRSRDIPKDRRGPVKGGRVTITRKDDVFTPRVLTMRLGQELWIGNRDPHNGCFHFKSRYSGDWNCTHRVGSPDFKARTPITHPEVGAVLVSDLWNWMRTDIAIFDHPYYALTGDDGRFRIDATDLPTGEYRLIAYHPHYKKKGTPIILTTDGTTQDLHYEAKKRSR